MSRVAVGIAWFAGVSGATGDFYNSNDEHVSLLQTKVNSVRSQELDHSDANYPDWCSMFEDVHIATTLYNYHQDFSVPGYFPLAKSSDGAIEMHGFACPAGAYKEAAGQGRDEGSLTDHLSKKAHLAATWTWLEGVATKVDDNLIEVFSPLHDPDKDRRHLLENVHIEDWKATVDELCPGNPIADAVPPTVSEVNRVWSFDYYVYSGHRWPKLQFLYRDAAQLFTYFDGQGFRNNGRGYAEWLALGAALKRCKKSLDSKQMVVLINGQLLQQQQDPNNFNCAIGPSPSVISNYWSCPWTDLPFASPPGSLQFMGGNPPDKSDSDLRVYLKDPDQRFVIQIRGKAGARKIGQPDADGTPVWTHVGADMLVDVWLRSDLRDVKDGGTICGAETGYDAVPSITPGESLFSAEGVKQLCGTCNWVPKVGRTFGGASADCAPDCLPMPDCNVPPPPAQSSPPPTPEWMCEAEHITLEDAMLACKDVQDDQEVLDECMSDYCASGGDPGVAEIAAEAEEIVHPSTTTIPPTLPPAGPDDCFRGVDLASFATLVASYCPVSTRYVRCQVITDSIDTAVAADWWQVCQRSGGDSDCDVAMRADKCAALAPTPIPPTAAPAATTTPAAVTTTLDPVVLNCPCTNGVALELKTPLYSNLGGQGPDLSSPASILYPDAGVYKGHKVNVLLSSTSPYAGKGSKNGVSGVLGRINVQTGTSVDLEVSLVDADSGEAISIDGLPMTILDLDEGKKGKGRASVSTCGAEQFVMTPSELTLTTDASGDCKTATSSVKGNAKDNPSSVEAALTSDVASGRIVSYVYQGEASVFAFTLTVAKGFGQRNFFLSFKPGAACADDSNMPAQCAAALSLEASFLDTAERIEGPHKHKRRHHRR